MSITDLPTALRDYGVRTSVELQSPRPGRAATFIATMGHHTAGRWRNAAGNVLLTPSLAICKHGRPDLPGPLCNAYGGRDFIARVITYGMANHPGQGGPYVVPGYRIPADSARPYVFGWEFEHDGLAEPLTDEWLDFQAKCLAATLEVLGRDHRSHLEHKTWAPGRKSDRRGITLTRARSDIAIAMTIHRTRGDDMALTKAEIQAIAAATAEETVKQLLTTDLGRPGGGDTVAVALQSGYANTQAILDALAPSTSKES